MYLIETAECARQRGHPIDPRHGHLGKQRFKARHGRSTVQHLAKAYKVRIAPTTLPNTQGKGLFAYKGSSPNQDIVFCPNDNIISYRGEPVSAEDLEHRYGNKTAPYALQLNKTSFLDAGCERGVGSLANHKSRTYANAKLSFFRGEVRLKATKNIRNGDEIFVSYGDLYRLNESDVSHSTKYVRPTQSASTL